MSEEGRVLDTDQLSFALVSVFIKLEVCHHGCFL